MECRFKECAAKQPKSLPPFMTNPSENAASYLQGVSKKAARKKSQKCSKIEAFKYSFSILISKFI